MSVLVGHQAPVTYVDFNKTIPNALLSSSFDGTCRIWDATNSAWAPKVMKASAVFGPMKGVTRFGGTAAGPSNATAQGSKPNTRSLDASAVGRHSDAAVTTRAAGEAGNGSIEHRLRSSDAPDAAAAGPNMPTAREIGLVRLSTWLCLLSHSVIDGISCVLAVCEDIVASSAAHNLQSQTVLQVVGCIDCIKTNHKHPLQFQPCLHNCLGMLAEDTCSVVVTMLQKAVVCMLLMLYGFVKLAFLHCKLDDMLRADVLITA